MRPNKYENALDRRINVRIDSEMESKIEFYSQIHGKTPSEIVRCLLEDALKRKVNDKIFKKS